MKKIFCIFAVVLILIMATVPCFSVNADDYCYLLFQSNGSVYFNDTMFDRSSGLKILSSTSISITGSNIDSAIDIYINGVFYGSARSNDIGYSFSVQPGDYVLITYNGFLCYSVSGIKPENVIGVFSTAFSLHDYDIDTYYFAGSPSSRFDCPQGYYSLDQEIFYSEPTTFSVNRNYSFSTVSQSFEPFIDFHKNVLLHSFDWVSNLTSTYAGVFIFVVSCIFICMIIMIIYLVIRRCRS